MSDDVLSGIRVLDFTWVGAGPLTTKVLADFGADVIKVESTRRPDPLRTTPPLRPDAPELEGSGYFANRNASKRSLSLNMTDPRARDIALRLVAQSDVCAQSFTPGTMEKWGLGFDQLRRQRPDLVYLAMPMQGEWGPHASFSGFGATLVALCGLFSLCGRPDEPPVGTGTNYPDHVPNPMHAAFAVVSALRHREVTGEGQYIELSQLESTLNVLGQAVSDAAAGRTISRAGNDVPYAAPHGVYPVAGADDWIAVSVLSDDQWVALRHEMGTSAPPGDLSDLPSRLAAVEQLDARMRAWTAQQDGPELVHRLQAAGVPAGVVSDARDVVNDPQLQHRRAIQRLDHPDIGPSLYTAPTPKLDATPGRLRRPAPRLGQHTRDICRELLAMDDDEIDSLIDEGVLT